MHIKMVQLVEKGFVQHPYYTEILQGDTCIFTGCGRVGYFWLEPVNLSTVWAFSSDEKDWQSVKALSVPSPGRVTSLTTVTPRCMVSDQCWQRHHKVWRSQLSLESFTGGTKTCRKTSCRDWTRGGCSKNWIWRFGCLGEQPGGERR